jgi:hypothetical protein
MLPLPKRFPKVRVVVQQPQNINSLRVQLLGHLSHELSHGLRVEPALIHTWQGFHRFT